MSFLHSNVHKRDRMGFSLLEVIITAAIIGIITTIVVIKYSVFDSAVLLKSQAFEIALDLRETQIFALSARGQATTFREEYGLHFDIENRNQYIFFRDIGTSEPVDFDSGEEIGLPRNIDARFQIKELCVTRDDASTECDNGGNFKQLDIIFKRPDFDAKFCIKNPGPNCWQSTNITEANIVIQPLSNLDSTRTIRITSTGLISVN